MRRIAFPCAVALLLASGADAKTLYKCVSRNGVSYQQTPCPAAARTVRTIETTPEPSPTPAELAALDRKARQDRAESAFLSHLAGTDRLATVQRGYAPKNLRRRADNQSRNESACQSAKATRERTLRRVGLDRTIDLLRRLDDHAEQACGRR